MITLLALSLICLVSIPLLMVLLVLFSVPIAIIFALLPWFLRLAAIVLLIRALLDQPMAPRSFAPAAILFVLSVFLR